MSELVSQSVVVKLTLHASMDEHVNMTLLPCSQWASDGLKCGLQGIYYTPHEGCPLSMRTRRPGAAPCIATGTAS